MIVVVTTIILIYALDRSLEKLCGIWVPIKATGNCSEYKLLRVD